MLSIHCITGTRVLKYDFENKMADLIDTWNCLGDLGAPLSNEFAKLINASRASSTWSVYSTGWNSLKNFAIDLDITLQWPVDIEIVRTYVVWCISKKNLKTSTVKLYLSAIKMGHTLQGLTPVDYHKDKIIDMLMSGAANVEPTPVKTRRAMNISTLLLLGHRIACTSWNKLSKQVVWAACTTCFFTSARLGEILASKPSDFDRKSTLCWTNVTFLDKEEMIIYIPSTKTSPKGEFIDLYPIPTHPCCPVAALRKLLVLQKEIGWRKDDPVFTFSSGRFLTTRELNINLKSLLGDLFSPGMNSITCHSFRAAIPSAVCAWPDKFDVKELQEWSRWKGSSYVTYCRSFRAQRRKLFNKIVSILDVGK
jgi:hypothetical protein